MHIAHVASECSPLAKVGGLGDAIYGLSKALTQLGHKVSIYLPKYDCISYQLLQNVHKLKDPLFIEENASSIQTTFWSATYEGLHLILVEPHHPNAYFKRGKIYGETDDVDRFLFFCKAASMHIKEHLPEILHVHDWLSAACSLFLKHTMRTVLTIHNVGYQGRCTPSHLQKIELPYEEEQMRDKECNESLSLLRGAIYSSTCITTVSPTYMKEILTPDGGFGLEEDLQKNKKKLHGILNGIDTEYWNPETDSFLAKNYTVETAIEGKKANKLHVQKHLGLPEENIPLVVCVTRLATQKGPDLIHYGIEKTVALGGQFVLLGSTMSQELASEFEALASSYSHVSIHLAYDESLAHLLYAAADMFLMPSISEPCGLAQMIALRYGTVPLVRYTGGLKDTIFDGKNGFIFEIPDNKGVDSVLQKGFSAYSTEKWQHILKEGMKGQYGWEVSAKKYMEIYTEMSS